MPPEAPYTERNCTACGRMFPAYGGHRKCLLCRRTRRQAADWRAQVGRPLSFREQQVVELAARALEDKEIAYELRIGMGSVKSYLSNIFTVLGSKLPARNRVALAVWWITEGRAEYSVQASVNPSEAA
jgi:DNA-binding NarL/FixJ family response regulator